MENEKSFGRFLISKRQEKEISARQLAIALDYSAVYICDIEKDRRPVPDEILEKLPVLLHLSEEEKEEMYRKAGGMIRLIYLPKSGMKNTKISEK